MCRSRWRNSIRRSESSLVHGWVNCQGNQIETEIHLFRFKFQDKSDSSEWYLPDAAQLFSTATGPPLPELQSLKSQLNRAKDVLESKEAVSWNRHVNFTNRAGIVVQALRRDYEPEMCTAVGKGAFVLISTYWLLW